MKTLNFFILSITIILSIIASIISCKKEIVEPLPTYQVTYEFSSDAPKYLVQIWDITNKNDFSDSVSGIFLKTIIYDYNATYRCNISTQNISNKKIIIRYNGRINSCNDSIYPTLNCGFVP